MYRGSKLTKFIFINSVDETYLKAVFFVFDLIKHGVCEMWGSISNYNFISISSIAKMF